GEVVMQAWTMRVRLAVAVLAGLVVAGAGLSLAPPNATDQPAPAQNDRPAAGTAAEADPLRHPPPHGAGARPGAPRFRGPELAGIGFRKTGEMVGLGEDLALHVWPADDSPKATTTLLTGKKQYGWRRALSADARFVAGFLSLNNETKVVVWDVSGDKPAEYLS